MPTRDRATAQVHHAIGVLERLRDSKLREVKAIDRAIRQLANTMPVHYPENAPASLEYKDVSITDAAKHWVGQIGTPQLTRDIAEALVNRGITTRSTNFVSTVYATLAHSDQFQRTHDGRWMLRVQEQREQGWPQDESN